MWSYYGSKSKVVHLYPRPEYDKIIEPFAGSARYSLRYFDRDVLLVDKYEVIVRIWKWLQQCSPQDILKLPTPKVGETINRDDFDCIEAAWLMGFMVQEGVNAPRLTVSQFADENIPRQKRNISEQLFKIRHWEIRHGDYREIANERATWFIDPPYQIGGNYYVKHNVGWDYAELGAWCQSRNGQIIVCENTKADWMPFLPMKKQQGAANTYTTEAIWTNRPTHFETQQLPLALGD